MADSGSTDTAKRPTASVPAGRSADTTGTTPAPSAALGSAAAARAASPTTVAAAGMPSSGLGNAATARAATPTTFPAYAGGGGTSGGGGATGSFGGGSFGGGGASGSWAGPQRPGSPGYVPMALPPPNPREPIELKGRPRFTPPADLAQEIKGQAGAPLWVAVKFGSLASGEIRVLWNGQSYETEEHPGAFGGYHPVQIHHPGFPVTSGARPVLGVKIRNNAPSGFLDWVTPASHAVDPMVFFGLHPVQELFGWKGIEADPPPSGFRRRLEHGTLDFHMPVSVTSGPFKGALAVSLRDEKFAVTGGFDMDVKGLSGRLPVKSDGTNRLFAGHRFHFDRSLGKAAGRLSGEIIGTFADGHVDVRGTLRYARAKPNVSGALSVVVTDLETAREHVRGQLGSDAPAVIQPADPSDRLAISGTGRIDFALNEWLMGNATVIVHPEGYVTARGEIVPTGIISLFAKRVKDQELLPKKEVSETIPGLDALVADVAVVVSVMVTGYASIGPGAMHDLRVVGLFSTDPDITNRFDFSGTMSFPARAGISAIATGDIRGRVIKLAKVASAGLKVKGDVELQMSAEAATVVGRRPAKRGGSEYFVDGRLSAQAQLVLGLRIDFTASLIVWEKHIPVHDRAYRIGGAAVGLNFSYIFGDAANSGLTLDFRRGQFDEAKYVDAVIRGQTLEEKAARRQLVESELKSETKNLDAPPPVEPPDPTAPVPPGTPAGPDKTLHAPFTMSKQPHDLALTLTRPPVLTMATVLEPLIKKVHRAITEVRKSTTMPAVERDSRVAALARIEIWAEGVQSAAARAAKAPRYLTPDVPGFKELATLIEDYGKDYGVTDLGTALEAIVVDPRKPESVLHRFPGLASNPLITAQVSRLIASGVPAPTLRQIVDNVRPVKEDPVLDVLRLLDKMIASGSPNWQAVIADLAIGGTKMKGALFVLRYIDGALGWSDVSFEVTDDPADDTGRRWDAWIKGTLYQFKSWYKWTSFVERSYLRQILEDYFLTRVGQQMNLRWVFETSLTRDEIVRKMKDAMAQVMKDLKEGKPPTVPGYTGGIALFIFTRVDFIVKKAE